MPILSLRAAALLSCVLVLAACQVPPSDSVTASAPRSVIAPDVPIAGMATIRAAEVSTRHARFSLAEHRIAMRLPDGFCAIGDEAPAAVMAMLRHLDKGSLEIKSMAMSCAILKGREAFKLPFAATVIGQWTDDDGAPLVLNADRRAKFDALVTVLHPRHANPASREQIIYEFIKGTEKSGNSVEHFDAESRDGHIRARLLMRQGQQNDLGNWVFIDLVVAPVGDRLLGVGVVNVSSQPSPPDVSEDSEQLFATLRQVRN